MSDNGVQINRETDTSVGLGAPGTAIRTVLCYYQVLVVVVIYYYYYYYYYYCYRYYNY